MFLKITSSGGHRYVRLVESFRNEDGQPRQRTLATLGRLDEQGGPLDTLLGGLLRAKGHPVGQGDVPQLRFESALALGDVWALDALWHELGFNGLGAIFRRERFTTAVEHAIRVMVFNRLCDAQSKLGVLRWLQTVSMPGIEVDKLTHQHLLRSMDALIPERIRAHASICFMALIIYRVMRQRLKRAGSKLSPESALAELRRIQRHSVSIDSATPVHGVSTVHPQQADVLVALNIKKPTNDAQMSLL